MTKNCSDIFNENLDEYKSIPFWSWNNSLDERELVKQIEEMASAGVGGFIIHARTGLKEEYLGDKWFSCIDACLKKAKAMGLQAWIYDENGWPSGFVGGKLLENEEYRAKFLEYGVGDFDGDAFAVFMEDDQKGFIRIKEKIDQVEKYHNIYLRTSPANTDILNPKVVDAFIAETHEKYYAKFPESFGKELVGFFTDEPQYYRYKTPYTSLLEEIENVKDGLIWLFVKDKRGYAFRQSYYGMLNKLYVENYYEKLYSWCRNHHCKLTGHSVEENRLHSQMYGGAGVMPTYEFESVPAIDSLCRETVSELSPKQVGSVASQLNKKIVLTESFACAGNDVTPRELKGIAESQYFHGVNKMCQHLYPYSFSGQAKFDHPPVFGPHSNWFEEFKEFNDYFTKLGYLIGNTKENVDIAIISPMHDVWLDYSREEDYQSVKILEDSFADLLLELRRNGVKYHFIDETILKKYGKINESTLQVGACSYHTILIPQMKNIGSSTYEILKAYQGKLCILGDLRYIDGKEERVLLTQNITLEEIKANTSIRFQCLDGNSFITSRSSELGDFLFIKNNSMSESSRITLVGIAENYSQLDIKTLKTAKITDDIQLPPNDSLILVKLKSKECVKKQKEIVDITDTFSVANISENYLVLDYVEYRTEQGNFSKKLPIPCVFENLLREDYKGRLDIRQTFSLREKMPLKFVMEKAKYLKVELNGNILHFVQNAFDAQYMESDIERFVKVGENELIYTFDFWQHDGVYFALFDPLATESLKNCLYYDTSIEDTYIKGDFVVNSDFSLSKRKDLPRITSELYKQGYPFFKGELTLVGNIFYDGEETVVLDLQGRFLVANIIINGQRTNVVLDSKKDITHLLKKGNNPIQVVLKSSLRNLFGPRHFLYQNDAYGVSPYNFKFSNTWKDCESQSKFFTNEYVSVPFGLDKILKIRS